MFFLYLGMTPHVAFQQGGNMELLVTAGSQHGQIVNFFPTVWRIRLDPRYLAKSKLANELRIRFHFFLKNKKHKMLYITKNALLKFCTSYIFHLNLFLML